MTEKSGSGNNSLTRIRLSREHIQYLIALDRLPRSIALAEIGVLPFDELLDRLVRIWTEDDPSLLIEQVLKRELTDEQQVALLRVLEQLAADADNLPPRDRRIADRAVYRILHTLPAPLAGPLGPPFEQLRDIEAHQQTFDDFVAANRSAILGSLRSCFLDAFDRSEALDAYVLLRSLPELAPDPAWLDECAVPDDRRLFDLVDRWLASHGAPAMGLAPPGLVALHELREENARILDRFAAKAQPLVRAWCVKNATQLPAIWNVGDEAQRFAELCGNEGLMDFRILSDREILAWLARTTRWPAAMPISLDLGSLGLSDVDLNSEARAAAEEKRRRDLERRTVVLDGRPIVADPANYRPLIDGVLASVEERFLTTPAGLAELRPFGVGGRPEDVKKRRRDEGRTYADSSVLSELQKVAVGLTGELLAYKWLQVRFPGTGDDSWRSGYRNYVLGGHDGDDSLGYDFEIRSGRTVLYFDVKASMSDTAEIELGPSQIAFAQQDRVVRSDRFRILLVRNVFDSATRTIDVLPNPFAATGVGLYRPVGSAMRYRFNLA